MSFHRIGKYLIATGVSCAMLVGCATQPGGTMDDRQQTCLLYTSDAADE